MNSRALLAVLACALLLGFFSFPREPRAAEAISAPGILIPLYMGPGSEWNEVVSAKEANPLVPIIAIINPSNGPGPAADPTYLQGVQSLQSAGVAVVGYVATGYGSQPTSTVERWISDYRQWYGVSGIMFDEMADVTGYESYYQALGAFVTSHSMRYTIGNPGTSLPASYAGILGMYVAAEDSFAVAPASLASAVGVDPPSSLAAILSSIPGTNQTYVDSLFSYVEWAYLTDQGAPNPYGALSSYFGNLVNMASRATGVASSTDTVTVDTLSTDGSPLPGIWMTVSENGVSIASGYSPLTFAATNGQTYQINASNHGLDTLEEWSTGAVSNLISLTAKQDVVLSAFFQTGPTVAINVDTVALDGSPLEGLWITLYQGESLIASGYSPASFSVAPGNQYNVTAANFGDEVFDHWGGGQTAPSILVTPATGSSLTAFYEAPSEVASSSSSSSSTSSSSHSPSATSVSTTTVTSTVTVSRSGGAVGVETSTETVTTTYTETVTSVQTHASTDTARVQAGLKGGSSATRVPGLGTSPDSIVIGALAGAGVLAVAFYTKEDLIKVPQALSNLIHRIRKFRSA